LAPELPLEPDCLNLIAFDACCAALRHATLVVQWGGSHVWKVGGKMFAIGQMGGELGQISFKAAPQAFAMMLESGDFAPAPYLARAGWVAINPHSSLPDVDLRAYLQTAHRTVLAKLPRKVRAELAG